MCMALESVNIPAGVKTIGENAFQNCMALTGITFPEGLESIGANAFYGCYSLEELVLPETLTTLGESSFDGCDGIVTLSLPGSIKTIPGNAFAYLVYLEELTINEGTTDIDEMAFINCESLMKLNLPSTLESIGYAAFAYNMLTEININAATPPACDATAFASWESNIPEGCKLYVPEGTKGAYSEADVWKDFIIEETTATGINGAHADEATETARYDISGQKLLRPASGINIIRMSDGTTRKVLVH